MLGEDYIPFKDEGSGSTPDAPTGTLNVVLHSCCSFSVDRPPVCVLETPQQGDR